MYTKTSILRLSHAHIDLITLANAVEKHHTNVQISCSTRSKSEQEDAFKRRVSKAKFGQSPHNFTVSLALDFVIITDGRADWTASKYIELGESIKKIAKTLGIKITWGGDFKSFKDYPHIELEDWKNLSKIYKLNQA